MLKRTGPLAGRLVWVTHHSRVLAHNPLGDPARRQFPVWLPPHYEEEAYRTHRFPVLYCLAGYLGAGPGQVNWHPLDENVPERVARLIQQKAMGPVILVFPDCYTALGGNQYLNSSALGRYADYLTREIVPHIDATFRTLAQRDHRGLFGKSSGGYGAFMHGALYPGVWGAVANHSGDAGFDLLYRSDWPNTLDTLARYRTEPRTPGPVSGQRWFSGLAQGRDDGRVARFLAHAWQSRKLSGEESHALMNLGMAASYDPDPRAPNGFRVPFHLETGALLPRRWSRWLALDPIQVVHQTPARQALQSLRLLYMDCGWRDQYHIHYGLRQVCQQLHHLKIPHVYEEFDDTHSGIDYRHEISLPLLYKALQPPRSPKA